MPYLVTMNSHDGEALLNRLCSGCAQKIQQIADRQQIRAAAGGQIQGNEFPVQVFQRPAVRVWVCNQQFPDFAHGPLLGVDAASGDHVRVCGRAH